ncbi:MAG: NlpC/P60 family protein [Acidimicrobiia bacterium]|jgi:cell wall-associated NlpC family hydrolase
MLTTTRRTRRPRRTLVRATCLLAALGGLLAAVPTGTAGAAPIDDLRTQAAQIEGQMNEIGSQLGVLYEQIKASQFQIDEAKQTIADSQASIESAQAEVTRITDLVRERAATVYRKAGLNGVGEFETDIRQQASRRKYANATSQRDDQLLNQLARAKEDLAARQDTAEKLRADVQKQQDVLTSQQGEFEGQQAQLEQLEAGVKGEIAQLVAEEQARRRAAEAAAQAAAKQAAGVNSGPNPNAPTFDTSKIPAPSGSAGSVVAYAMAQLGKDYCYAGVGPSCYDCSGLTQQAWATAGVYMPHNSEAQFGMFPRVPLSAVQPGDIVWFPGHVGIYVGGGAVVNATHTGDFVRIHDISLYQGAVRPG